MQTSQYGLPSSSVHFFPSRTVAVVLVRLEAWGDSSPSSRDFAYALRFLGGMFCGGEGEEADGG